MGNTFAKENSNDTIHWNSLDTDKISDTVKMNLSNDSKLLLERIHIDLQTGGANIETEQLTDIDNIFSNFKNVVKQNSPKNSAKNSAKNSPHNSPNELSDTSPFISSEMYNLLMKPDLKNNSSVQKGGGKIEDDSSTSSTSSSSGESTVESTAESGSEKPKPKSEQKNKKNKKINKTESNESTESNEPSESNDSNDSNESSEPNESNYLSYISSSAHEGNTNESNETTEVPKKSIKSNNKTNKSYTNKRSDDYESSSDGYITSHVSNEESTIKNLNNKLPNSSINTSDINMITE